MATAGMRSTSLSSPPSTTVATPGPHTNGTETFNWEIALERDRRLPQMSKYMEQILLANFPTVSKKLRKEEPPARHYEPHTVVAPPLRQQQNRPVTIPAATPATVNGSHNGTARAASLPRAPQQQQHHQQQKQVQPPQSQSAAAHPHTSEFKLHWSSGDSSSEVDMREVDPMDELSDFETQPTPPPARARVPGTAVAAARDSSSSSSSKRWQTHDDGDDEMNGDGGASDVGMDGDREDESDDDDTVCVVCHTSENEDKILLCDECNAEYHLYCLTPPLMSVPLDQDWFCPRCAPAAASSTSTSAQLASSLTSSSSSDPTVAAASTGAASSSVAPPTVTASAQQSSSKQSTALGNQNTSSQPAPPHKQEPQQPPPPPISIAQTFESDAARSNELLVHACQCDALKCVDATFHEFCAPMKRFLRSACWASHSDRWRAYRVARATAELFAYHAMQCREAACNVPMCDELRAEEVV